MVKRYAFTGYLVNEWQGEGIMVFTGYLDNEWQEYCIIVYIYWISGQRVTRILYDGIHLPDIWSKRDKNLVK